MTTAFLHGLRMLGDLLIYGTFAAFFTACLGGGPVPLLLLLPAVCYGVSACFSQRRILRTGCAVLSLLGLLLVPDRVDQAAYLPAVFYAVYLAWKGDCLLSASRQSDVFFLFCKVYPVFAVALSLIWDADVMLTVSLPLAVWAAFLQIFLMRVLRQAPKAFVPAAQRRFTGGSGCIGLSAQPPRGARRGAGHGESLLLRSGGSRPDPAVGPAGLAGGTRPAARHDRASALDRCQKREPRPRSFGKPARSVLRRPESSHSRGTADGRRTATGYPGPYSAGGRLRMAVPPAAPGQ